MNNPAKRRSVLYSILSCPFTPHGSSLARLRSKPLPPSIPATIMIPLCGGDFRAYENYASFCRLDYPEYQIVFGAQGAEDSSLAVVERIMRDFPAIDIDVVVSSLSIGQNPKVANLNNMLTKAKHEVLVLVDSDMHVRRDYLQAVVPPLAHEEVGLVTCLYRAGAAPSLPAKLEALGIATEFIPGVLVADFIEGMSFAFGATIALTKEKLRLIGGFQAIADHLADDYMLGNLLYKMGYQLRLLPYVVETMLPASSFMGMVRHQIRWARGIRACRPLGHLGSLITHGIPLAFFNVLASQAEWEYLLLLALTVCLRYGMAWVILTRTLQDEISKASLYLLPIRDFLSFFVWCVSLFGKKVEWRGKRYRIVEKGKIVPL